MTRATYDTRTPFVHFLLYTRATFDYSWIYGLEDRYLEKELHEHLLKWLGDVRRVTTFFKFRNHHVLTIAEESETRTDPQSRPIVQRAVFLWKPVAGLCYRHINVLAAFLEEKANNVYENLPNDVYRTPPTSLRQFDLDLKELNRLSSKPRNKKSQWQLPEGCSWTDVLSKGLTVEVPSSWGFDRMIDGLADIPLLDSDVIFIGNGLHFENRYPADRAWIVSAKAGSEEETEEIKVLDAQGQPVQIMKKTKSDSRNSSVESPKIEVSNNAGTSSKPLPQPETKSAKQPPGKNQTSSGGETAELERLFLEFSNFSQNESEKIGIIKKFFERYDVTIRSAETRILLLLIPARHETPPEIITSWHFLISEILLSYQNRNVDLVNEWIRRAYRLEDITNEHLSTVPARWRSEFKTACGSLRSILQDSL